MKRDVRMLLTALILVMALSFGVCATAAGNGETSYRAMLIGIDGYQNNELSGCVTDANRVASMLKAANEAGAFYQEPTIRTNLQMSEISSFLRETETWNVDEDDVTFFYFAGHGYMSDKGTPGIVGKDSKMLKVSELRTALDALPGVKVLVFDCRYADSLLAQDGAAIQKALEDFDQAILDIFTPGAGSANDYYVIASSTLASSEAVGLKTGDAPRGIVTSLVTGACGYDYAGDTTTELLGDANGNGAVSLKEVRDYVQSGIKELKADDPESKLYADIAITPENSAYPVMARRATAEVLEVSLDETALTVPAGKSYQIQATTQPANASMRSVYWTSSDLSVATVNESGEITGIKPGQVKIAATTANGLTVTCDVTVRDIKFVDSLTMSTARLALGAGASAKLDLTIVPSYANENIRWVSRDPGIASVDGEGNVKCQALGSTVITATSENGVEAACAVEVIDAAKVVTAIKLNKSAVNIYVGESRQLEHQIKPDDAADPVVTYVSSNPEIVKATADGLISGEGVGEASVTATTSSGVNTSCMVVVQDAEILLNKEEVTLKTGTTGALKTQTKPANLASAIVWESDNTEVATVENGRITAVAVGECNVTASLPSGASASCKVAVSGVLVKGVQIKPAKSTMEIGAQLQLESAVKPDNASIKTLTWASSHEMVAQVDDTGMVTAIGPGKALITAKSHNGKVAKCQILVKPIAVTELKLSESEITLVAGLKDGNKTTLTAETMPVSAGNGSLKWKSSNPKIASVDDMGTVTAKGAGKAVITAMSLSGSKVKASCNVTVEGNFTVNKTPVTGSEEKVYTSARRVYYKSGYLVVELYFANKTATAQAVPSAGNLILTLADGENITVAQVKAGKNKLKAGKGGVLTYKTNAKGVEGLEGLDLRGVSAEIVPEGEMPTAASSPAASPEAAKSADATLAPDDIPLTDDTDDALFAGGDEATDEAGYDGMLDASTEDF